MKTKIYDVIIIGAGTAGLAAQRVIAKKTKNYLLIDHGPLGTTCARVGCMPSKVLIESAALFHDRHLQSQVGVKSALRLKMDQNKFWAHVRKLNDVFAGGMREETLAIPKANFILGKATFVDQNTLQVKDKTYKAKKIIIATGSSPVIPDEFKDLRKFLLTSDDIFKIKRVPKKLAVIGTGIIGLELAQALSRLGTKVTVFGSNRGLAGLQDPEIFKLGLELFAESFELIPSEVKAVSKKEKIFHLTTKNRKKFKFDAVLVATGRKPNISQLGLNFLNLPLNSKGALKFNPSTGRIGQTPLYVAGDCSDYMAIQHEASFSGRISGLNALSKKDQVFKRFVPMKIAFTDPQVAQVGQTWDQLTKDKIKFEIAQINFEKQSRALIQFKNYGLGHVYISPKTRMILGAEILSAGAEHLVHYLALAITHKMTVDDLLASPYYHPVMLEGLSRALKRVR